jgi:DNA gyrase subunit A
VARTKTVRASSTGPQEPSEPTGVTSDITVQDEMSNSFLAYAMSVIVSRALPDARDGLKPVHRRILYSMHDTGLRPDKSFVKCARIVGDTMGRFHPHGDSAIYEALVRMAQDFSMRVKTIDGHGNFGTHADGAAAMRYTEARMAAAAVALTGELGEDTVDMRNNYDGKLLEPSVLPARYPNLLVNGGTGIAVGMATNLAPHNLNESVNACKYLIDNPGASVDDLIAFVDAPDYPTGGIIVDTAGAHEAYRTGKGQITIRAKTEFCDVTGRKRGIVVTELPYQVGPEKVTARIKEVKDAKKLDAVTRVVDLSDRKHGLRLMIELRSGADEHKVLRELFRLTPLQENFSIHSLALVDGSPRTLNLLQMVTYFVNFRLETTRRRSEYRRRKAQERAHLLEGYLLALAHIDEIVAVIRASKDSSEASLKLVEQFELSPVQAAAILEMPLRRLTSLEVEKITTELAELNKVIAELTRVLTEELVMRELVKKELDEVAAELGTPRRTRILGMEELAGEEALDLAADAGTDIADEPTTVWLSRNGNLGRATEITGRKGKGDAMVARLDSTTRSRVGVVSADGTVHYLPVYDIADANASTARGNLCNDLFDTKADWVGLVAEDKAVSLVTRSGMLKRLDPSDLPKRSGSPLITLKDGDSLAGAFVGDENDATNDFVVITSTGQLLRTGIAGVNSRGYKAGGVAGMNTGDGRVIGCAVAGSGEELRVVTLTDSGSVKVTPLSEYPVKGRGGIGVRAHKFLALDTALVSALVGELGSVRGMSSAGALVALPAGEGRRDGSGTPTDGVSSLTMTS